jgi:hypothetical protein
VGTHLKHIALLSAAFGLVLASPAFAAGAGAPTEAVVLRPLSIVNTEDLQFGTLISSPASGTVTIDPINDARSVTGGVTQAGGGPHAAQFFTYGGPLQSLQVNRGPLPILNRVGGGATMAVTGLTLNGPVLRFLTAAGILDLRVGGTMNVGANQLAGDYSATFQIIVTYF